MGNPALTADATRKFWLKAGHHEVTGFGGKVTIMDARDKQTTWEGTPQEALTLAAGMRASGGAWNGCAAEDVSTLARAVDAVAACEKYRGIEL